MKLYHNNELIGEVSNPISEGLEMTGKIALYPTADSYKEVFEFVKDPDKMLGGEEPPFDENFYFDNWFLEDDTGTRKEIVIPGIYYEDQTICWRYC